MSAASTWRAISPTRRSRGGLLHPLPLGGRSPRAKRAGRGVVRARRSYFRPPTPTPPHKGEGSRRAQHPPHPIRMGARGRHHQGNDLRRRAREPRPQEAAGARAKPRSPTARVRRRGAGLHHAGIRAQRNRARPRHHPVQHQPRRTGADDHRPQLPGEDQRQYRQLRRHLLGRGGSREDGVGDPLGRRHGDGPLHRPQHPQHPRMDPAQFAGAHRHRADLPGAGEGRRRSGQARLGGATRTR